jgi:hypothetical protein
MAHLLGEQERVDLSSNSAEWKAFAKKLRAHDPLATIDPPMRTYLITGHMPPLPLQFVADGRSDILL